MVLLPIKSSESPVTHRQNNPCNRITGGLLAMTRVDSSMLGVSVEVQFNHLYLGYKYLQCFTPF